VTSRPGIASSWAREDDHSGTPAAGQRRTVRLLVLTQVLGGLGVAVGIAVGALLVAELAGAVVAGLAASASVVGAALVAVPVSRLMDRRGRRPGLVAAYATGALGALVVAGGAWLGSAAVALAGLVLFGGATAAGLQARYAATDLAPPERRGTALSTVVWATTLGAVAGPNLADPAGGLAEAAGLPPLAGPFVFSAGVFALAAGALALLLRPDPLLLARSLAAVPASAAPGGGSAGRRTVRSALGVVRAAPDASVGLGAVSVGHAVMVGVMSMTPVHMDHGGASLRVVGLAISVHIAGMYAFAPLVGAVADRAGRRPVVGAGVAVLLAALAVCGTAPETGSVQLGVGLFLLGVGWSCTLVAGSTMLTESVATEERPSVQGAADLVMGLAGAGAGLLAGVVVGVTGYPYLALLGAVALVPLVAAVLRVRTAPLPG